MLSLREYGSDDSSGDSNEEDAFLHLKPKATDTSLSIVVASAPGVVSTREDELKPVDPRVKELPFNAKYEQMYAPMVGPENPFKTQQQKASKNMLSGFMEPSNFNDFQFENQRRTFHSYGYAMDPTADASVPSGNMVGRVEEGEGASSKSVFEVIKKREGDKRKRQINNDPADIDGYLGPWAKYADEKTVMKPSEEEQAELDVILAKRSKKGKQVEQKPMEEKTTLHIKEERDYQGRTYMHVPVDVGTSLRPDSVPEKCFLPKTRIHTWTGHTKGVSTIRWFPSSAHLLLSCGMDSKIKLWEVYGQRRCLRSYLGHHQAVRDVSFNNDGTQFLSASYDRYIKLWDTETGACLGRFTNKKVPYCVKFNPDEDKQNLFVAGMADKKIVCWDTRTTEVVQEYDRHLGAVNSITFIDGNRRFVSTSDDKSLRLWEWNIPVDFKYIAEPGMHSMPSVSTAPNGKWLAGQSMDNQIKIFNILNRFKYMRKKVFKGHMVAGYSCSVDFSPDMSYLISGDADGKLFIWDWKTTKLLNKFKAHEQVCIACLWHPHETSKVATAGWDGLIHYWD